MKIKDWREPVGSAILRFPCRISRNCASFFLFYFDFAEPSSS